MNSNQILSDDKNPLELLVDGSKMRPTNPIRRTYAIFKKSKNCHISATIWPILKKFEMVMCLGPLHLADN